MRWFQIDEGAKERQYLQMYSSLPVTKDADVMQFITNASKNFQRQDRVQWLIRWHRLWLADRLSKQNPEAIDERVIRKFVQSTGAGSPEAAANMADYVMSNLLTFKHYIDMPVKEITDLVWDKQTPEDLLNEFKDIEADWRSSATERGVQMDGNTTVVVKCDERYTWFDLETHSCSEEAKAMGHCGNRGGNPGDTILSLRKHIYDDVWEPALTFILDRNGLLGEMKGRGNEAPAERYYTYIVTLLRQPCVVGIKGGGYLPENNFSMDELPADQRDALYAEKPGLRPLWEFFDEWHKQGETGKRDPALDAAFRVRLEAAAENMGSYKTIDWDQEEIIIETTSIEFVGSKGTLLGAFEEIFDEDNLEEILGEFGADNPERVTERFHNDYYDAVATDLVPYESSFKLSGVFSSYDPQTKSVVYQIGFDSFVREDDDVLGYADGWLDTDDYNEYSDMDIYSDDPVVDTVLVYAVMLAVSAYGSKPDAAAKARAARADFAEAIISRYQARTEKNGSSFMSHTENDPRQLSMDFPERERP